MKRRSDKKPTWRPWALHLGMVAFLLVWFGQAWAAAGAEPGMSFAEIMRRAGLAAGIVAIVWLLLTEFFIRPRWTSGVYLWALLFGMLAMPTVTLLGTTQTVFEETKTVQSCNSCHVMHDFVDDMLDPESASLAARHFQNNWIPTQQCYQCHTTYGAHGNIEAKRDGFRHWLLYVTGTWPEPIRYVGSYPNFNCTHCHVGTPAFEAVPAHEALAEEMRADRVACTQCHGPPHPTPLERTISGAPMHSTLNR